VSFKRYTMKTLFLSFTLLFSVLSFSQKLIIDIFEKQEMVKFSNSDIDSVLLNPDIVYDIDSSNRTTFVIDFYSNTSTYFVNGVYINDFPVETSRVNDDILIVKILEEYYDYGLIINTNQKTESVTWFWFSENRTTIKVMTKFIIQKPS
jgi:hypothetical protein